MSRTIAIAALGVVAVGLGVTAGVLLTGGDDESQFAQCRESVVVGGADQLGGPFTLVSETGETVTEADVLDGPTLVYFGYTSCPDVCPIDLFRNGEVAHLLDEQGVAITPVFITIDPARDTPQQVAEYTDFMHPRMLGLTGSQEQIDVAARAYGVYAARVGEPDDPDYLMDHSSYSYLMSPEHGFLEFYSRQASVEQMVENITCYANAM